MKSQRHYRPQRALSLLTGLLTVAVSLSARAEREEHLSHSFPVKPGQKLSMDVDRGSISVTTHAGNTVDIQVDREVTDCSDEEADRILTEHTVSFDQKDDEVNITAKGPDQSRKRGVFGWLSGGRIQLRVKYEVAVPREFNLDLKTAGGGIRISEVTGNVNARTAGGSIKVNAIDGPLELHTSGGSLDLADCMGRVDAGTSGGAIKVNGIQGNAKLRTSGGSIHLRQVAGAVVAQTSGGRIEVDALDGSIQGDTSGGGISVRFDSHPAGDCELKTSGGNIDVFLPSDARLDIDAQASGGGVSSDLPVTVAGKIKNSRLQGKLNGGGHNLTLRTSGGSVRLKSN